jgi:hypothetical protein
MIMLKFLWDYLYASHHVASVGIGQQHQRCKQIRHFEQRPFLELVATEGPLLKILNCLGSD